MGAVFGPRLFAVQFISLQKGNESFCAKDRGDTERVGKVLPSPTADPFPPPPLTNPCPCPAAARGGDGDQSTNLGPSRVVFFFGIFRIFQRIKKRQEMNSNFIWFRHHPKVKA